MNCTTGQGLCIMFGIVIGMFHIHMILGNVNPPDTVRSMFMPISLCHDLKKNIENIWNELNTKSISCHFISIGEGDGAKNICNLPYAGATIVSFGMAHGSVFEIEMLKYSKNVIIVDCLVTPPDGVLYHNKCIDTVFVYSDFLLTFNLTKVNILKVDAGMFAWDIINDVVLDSMSPDVLLVDLPFLPAMDCTEFIKAQAWASLLRSKYLLVNWRRNVYGCAHCIELSYEKIRADFPGTRRCLGYTIMNEGLGGSMFQIMYGMVLAAEQSMEFCLHNSLVDPQPQHMSDYSWFTKYFDIPLCADVSKICETEMSWDHNGWTAKHVVSRWKSYYAVQHSLALQRISTSPLNRHFDNCVHVRSGDYNHIPDVNWEGKEIRIFGSDAKSFAFCSNNTCDYEDKYSVEYDFVNLANCEDVIYSRSTFCLVIHLFSPLRQHQQLHPYGSHIISPDFFY